MFAEVRRCLRSSVVMLVLAAFGLAGPAASAPAANPGGLHLVPSGAPAPIITDEQRDALGLKFGPDAPIDFFQGRDGRYYLNSSGSLGARNGPGRNAAWNLHVDSQLTRVLALDSDAPATGPGDVRIIMTSHAAECGSGRQRLRATDPGGAACNQYFDRDYAGGGAYFRCPDNATSVYFYHGENHTSPDGVGGKGGWFGLGVGVFNDSETSVTRSGNTPASGGNATGQIIGMNMSTTWRGGPGAYTAPPQDNPFNGVPSVVSGADGYLYLYHGNATTDPAYNPSACRPACMSISRAPITAFCRSVKSGSPVSWQNYYQGAWTQPAVQGAGSASGFGAGGAFTPLIPDALAGEFGGTVTYMPQRRLYVMTRLYKGGIDARYSTTGLSWSGPQMLLPEPAGTTPNGDAMMVLYPRVIVTHTQNGNEQYLLTYVLATKGRFWRWAQLMRQPLTLASG